MIVEIVTFPAPQGWDRTRTLDDAKSTIPKWTANRELVRKHFLRGIGASKDIGAGVYLWPSIEAAQRAHGEDWRASVRKRTGGEPEIRYFDLMLMIDNAEGAVTEWDADGYAHALTTA